VRFLDDAHEIDLFPRGGLARLGGGGRHLLGLLEFRPDVVRGRWRGTSLGLRNFGAGPPATERCGGNRESAERA
jgi:hypothetical protein